MSLHAMSEVWKHSGHSGSELLMLLAIADRADDDGRAYPSVSTLASKCRTTPRYALKLLEALTRSGELEVHKHQGPMGRGGRTNLYRIALERYPLAGEAVHQGTPVHRSEPVNQKAVHQGALVNQGAVSSAPEGREVVHQRAPNTSEIHQETEEGAAQLAPSASQPSRPKRQRARSADVTLADWLQAVQQAGEKPVPGSHAVFAYAQRIGLPNEFLQLAWVEFKAKHLAPPTTGKRAATYADWRAVFLNAVKGNWLKLWYLDGQQYALTTAGQQAQRDMQAQLDDATSHPLMATDCIPSNGRVAGLAC